MSAASILIVDDEETVRKVATRMLQRIGYDVHTVSSGDAALQLLGDGAPFALVMLDVSMPGLSGEETVGEIRRRQPHLPVVLMSGFSEDELSHGEQVTFLQKPFSADSLRVAVETALRSGGLGRRE